MVLLSPFGRLCKELGLYAMRRKLHPKECAYTCYSKTHNTLSRIDLTLCSADLIPYIVDVNIEPRGISDHSPLVVHLTSGHQASNMSWRLNPFWLELFPKEDAISTRIVDFWSLNLGSAPIQVVWDALKAYLWENTNPEYKYY